MMEQEPSLGQSARIKSKIVDHCRKTLLGAALTETTPGDWKYLQASEFEKAKKVSDFIGMLMRIGFVYLTIIFFYARSIKADVWWNKSIFVCCAVFSLSLYVVMIFRLSGVISIFWLADTSHWKHRAHKVSITLLGLLLTGVAVYGVSMLAQAVAKASSLLH